MAYVRGSQIQFVVLPEMLAKAPFFNRIKMWRKYKGHAVFGGGGAAAAPVRGQSAVIMQKSQSRRLQVLGGRGLPVGPPGGAGGAPAPGYGAPPPMGGPGGRPY